MPPITAAVFTAKEHMLLRIIIYLLQFLLCLIQVTLSYRRFRNRLRQVQTTTHLTAIRRRNSHYCLSNSPSLQTRNSNGLFLLNHPAYSIPAFNGRECLVRIHREITDLLHYQSHVRLAAASHLLPSTRTANQQEREVIIEFLKEERACIRTLWALLDMAENNDVKLQGLYEDSPVTADYYNMVRTPTLCKPDTSDRPYLFSLSTYLI
jgi:hypothetical protein